MAKLETEHIFNGSIRKCFKGIRNYNDYASTMPGITKVEILPAVAPGSSCQVRYELNLIKKFYYILDMFEVEPQKIRWTLADSNVMKANDGSWDLSENGPDKTKAKYNLEIKFKGLVPSAITDKVAQANLPSMFSGFQKLIDKA